MPFLSHNPDEDPAGTSGKASVPGSSLRQGRWIILLAFALSLLAHLLSYVELPSLPGGIDSFNQASKKNQVKIRVVESKPKRANPPKKITPPKKDEAVDGKRIVETPQQATQAPDKADYLGPQNHKTKKETKVALRPHPKAADPGQKGKTDSKQKNTQARDLARQVPPHPAQAMPQPKPTGKSATSIAKNAQGSLTFGANGPKGESPLPRNAYEQLLPTANELAGQVHAGYQDYVDGKMQDGDAIDLNTTEYRYVGYFTEMRKAIELVWNYPLAAAQRGMQGEVGLEFVINKDGSTEHVKVVRSSGYDILDNAIVEAIKAASPFSPLPDGFKKNHLLITGTFRYVLTGYADAH